MHFSVQWLIVLGVPMSHGGCSLNICLQGDCALGPVVDLSIGTGLSSCRLCFGHFSVHWLTVPQGTCPLVGCPWGLPACPVVDCAFGYCVCAGVVYPQVVCVTMAWLCASYVRNNGVTASRLYVCSDVAGCVTMTWLCAGCV